MNKAVLPFILSVSTVVVLTVSAISFYGGLTPATQSTTRTPNNSNTGSTSRGFYGDYISNNASQYLLNGYYAERANLTQLRDGQVINLGGITFRYERFLPQR